MSLPLNFKQTVFTAVIGATVLFNPLSAKEFASQSEATDVLELYTSEGCSSCPPAENWLSTFKDRPDVFKDVIPMAFHVDYWDYIGWKDPYASKEYSQRQRRYAHQYNESTVYTPGIRKNGDDWRLWRFFGNPETKQKDDVGKVSITVDKDGSFLANYEQSAEKQVNSDALQLNVAILGVGISNEVTRGENRGKTLEHDFIVLGISRYASFEANQWKGELPEAIADAPKYAIAVWVTEGQKLEPIQATGGYLAKN